MTIEQAPLKEAVQPGQLFFVGHPGSELFSSYGLTTHAGRPDQLAGLLMVDRPHPVDPVWLARVEQLYGETTLLPMTASGERGILTQMRVVAPSLQFLRPSSHPLTTELTRALQPLLETPPAPVLKLAWDRERTSGAVSSGSGCRQCCRPSLRGWLRLFGGGAGRRHGSLCHPCRRR